MEDLDLKYYLRAGYSLIWLRTSEYEGLIDKIVDAARHVEELAQGQLHEWTGVLNGKGHAGIRIRQIASNEEPAEGGERAWGILEALCDIRERENAILVIHNFRFWQQANNVQALLESAIEARKLGSHIILTGPDMDIPPELRDLITVYPMKLPNEEIIRSRYKELVEAYEDGPDFDSPPTAEDIETAARAALGLPLITAESAFALSVARYKRVDVPLIQKQKEAEIRKSDVLEYIQDKETLTEVGGFEDLKAWLHLRRRAFTPEAREYGLPFPRGFLICGIPGSGKSLCAKAVASFLQLPLLRLDLGKVFRSLVGASEEAMRVALDVAEAVSPAILWIDEMEKGLAGLQSSGTLDSGVAARVVGTILTWRAETDKPVMLIATVNDVTMLPPEVTRKGRFDELWATDLPRSDERKEIFQIHIRKVGRDPDDYDIALLASKSEGFVGAEIEECVRDAMFTAFDDAREFETGDILKAIEETSPMSERQKKLLEPLREWVKTMARPVSTVKKKAKIRQRPKVRSIRGGTNG